MHAASAELGLAVTKTLRLTPGATAWGLPYIQGELFAHQYADGRLLAQLDAEAVTELRTAACAAVAVDLLSPPEARRMVLFGAGPIAEALAMAIVDVRPIDGIRVVSREAGRGVPFASRLSSKLGIEVGWGGDPGVVSEADIVCTATRSSRPLFDAARLRPRSHVCAVGAYRPDMIELPRELLLDCDLFVDTLEGCEREAGDLLAAFDSDESLRTAAVEIGELLASRAALSGRRTVYKSVGHASQDLYAAAALINTLATGAVVSPSQDAIAS